MCQVIMGSRDPKDFPISPPLESLHLLYKQDSWNLYFHLRQMFQQLVGFCAQNLRTGEVLESIVFLLFLHFNYLMTKISIFTYINTGSGNLVLIRLLQYEIYWQAKTDNKMAKLSARTPDYSPLPEKEVLVFQFFLTIKEFYFNKYEVTAKSTVTDLLAPPNHHMRIPDKKQCSLIILIITEGGKSDHSLNWWLEIRLQKLQRQSGEVFLQNFRNMWCEVSKRNTGRTFKSSKDARLKNKHLNMLRALR